MEPLIISSGAHPRSRGEHIISMISVPLGRGSSPLARGTRAYFPLSKGMTGLIPARAGNTFSVFLSLVIIGAHPRSRGEHCPLRREVPQQGGSSPLARGTPNLGRHVIKARGFIPARAGNTGKIPRRRTLFRVHPRSRGEHGPNLNKALDSLGSSPLARGTQRHSRNLFTQRGFIPARAGNTMARIRAIRSGRVHPRSRGEHF